MGRDAVRRTALRTGASVLETGAAAIGCSSWLGPRESPRQSRTIGASTITARSSAR